jgi:hypothetical protein
MSHHFLLELPNLLLKLIRDSLQMTLILNAHRFYLLFNEGNLLVQVAARSL